MKPLSPDKIAWACQTACVLEVSAEKPGNVTKNRAFNDVSFESFVVSAEAIGLVFIDAHHISVGQTILRAVQKTRALAGTNTNLGIVLLLAPLAKAAGIGHSEGLRAGVSQVLALLNVDDAVKAYEGICLARPAGLGKTNRYDVFDDEIKITLLESMILARDRDSVAREYSTDFAITFGTGYPVLRKLWNQGHALSESIVQTYLTLLAHVPDTLIARKNGQALAEKVSRRAEKILDAGGVFSKHGRREIIKLDNGLRDECHRLNPGTTADLVAASLFVFLIDFMVEEPRTDNSPHLVGKTRLIETLNHLGIQSHIPNMPRGNPSPVKGCSDQGTVDIEGY